MAFKAGHGFGFLNRFVHILFQSAIYQAKTGLEFLLDIQKLPYSF